MDRERFVFFGDQPMSSNNFTGMAATSG